MNGGRLFVVTAVAPPPEWMGAPRFQEFVDAEHERGRALLEEAIGLLPEGTDYVTELIDGDAADAIVNVADSRKADAIVVGSRGLGRVRSVLGSVSHDVLHLSDRPVVVIPERSVNGKEEKS